MEQEVVRAAFVSFPDADEKEVMAFIQKDLTREMYEFRMLAMRDMRGAVKFLLNLVQDAVALLDAKKRDPARYAKMIRERELEKAAEEQARAARMSDGEGRKKHLEELRKVLDEAFKVRQELIGEDIQDMEKDLQKLKALVKKRRQSQRMIVSRRITELTREMEHLRW
jgi:hypothetical protein